MVVDCRTVETVKPESARFHRESGSARIPKSRGRGNGAACWTVLYDKSSAAARRLNRDTIAACYDGGGNIKQCPLPLPGRDLCTRASRQDYDISSRSYVKCARAA